MRKLFLLSLALLASIGLWAADPTLPAKATPTSALDVVDGDADVATKFNTISNKKLYTTYSLGDDIRNTALKSLKKPWIAAPANDGGGSVSSITWETGTTDAQKYGFRTSSLNKWGINSSRYCGIRVTNCTEVAVSTKSNGTKDNKTLQLQVYVKNNANWDFVEALGADKYNSSKAYVLTSSAMDKTKEYVILLTSGSSSSSDAYEIRFASGTLSPTLKAIKVAGISCNIVSNNPSDQDTITGELPFGTILNDAIDSIKAADVTLGGSATSYTIANDHSKITVTDGDVSKDYIFNLTVNSSASSDATLKALKINGADVKGFAANKYDYKDTIAYSAALPVVTAEVNDPTANAIVTNATVITKVETETGTASVVVTAQDGTTVLTYTIAFVRADAEKKIKEIFMSNKYMAYIPEGDATNIYAYYLAGEEAATVDSVNRSANATWTVNEGKLRVTGEDSLYSEYTLNISSVTPVEYTTNVITFDSTNMYTVNAWVKAPYGFDQKKGGWKFSKTDGDFTREIAGKTHIEMFLPACDTIVVAAGAEGTERDVKFYINGVQFGDKKKLAEAGDTLVVKQSTAFMLTVASAQTGGDGGIGSIRMARSIFTVTYNAGDGECATTSAKVVNGAAAILPAVTPQEGYRFTGWFDADSEGTKVGIAGEEVIITKDSTLYAQYSALYAITCATGLEYGTVEADKAQAIAGETVTLTVTPNEGYKIASVKYNDGEEHVIEPVNKVYSFTMPAAAVTVSATFSLATALDNTDVNAKAVKRLENGILVIEKNGRLFNAQGQLVK